MYSDYIVSLGLDDETASRLHLEYYTKYGLALRGLTSNHQIGEVTVSRYLLLAVFIPFFLYTQIH
jgi:hypothetical protein